MSNKFYRFISWSDPVLHFFTGRRLSWSAERRTVVGIVLYSPDEFPDSILPFTCVGRDVLLVPGLAELLKIFGARDGIKYATPLRYRRSQIVGSMHEKDGRL